MKKLKKIEKLFILCYIRNEILISGLDFAHFTNGYVYHTKYDDINLIDRGVYQNTGDNMLALVKAFTDVTDESFVAEKFDGKKLVYYDFCGLVVFYYSQTTNTILNLAIILLIFYNVLQNTFVITEGNFSNYSNLIY